MKYINYTITGAIGLVLILVYVFKVYRRKNTYCVVTIKVEAFQSENGTENTFNNHCNDVILGRIFCEDIMNEVILKRNLTDLALKMKKNMLTYSEYLSNIKKYFVEILLTELEKMKINIDHENLQLFFMSKFSIYETELLLQESKSSYCMNSLIDSYENFCNFRSQLQYICWRSLNDFYYEFHINMYKMIEKKEMVVYSQYMEDEIARSYKYRHIRICNYKTCNKQIFKKNSLNKICDSKNYTHILIDFTYLYIDVFVFNMSVEKTKYKPKMKYINGKILKKMFIEMVENSLISIFTDVYVLKAPVYNKFTIVFDIITILEYVNINTEISQQIYNGIIDYCKSLYTKIQVIANELDKKYATNVKTEIVGAFENYILKVTCQRNTKKLNHLLSRIENSEFRKKLLEILEKSPLDQNTVDTRWFFKNTLSERIIERCRDPQNLYNLYDDVKILTENMCKCQNHCNDICLLCKMLIKHFGLICVKIGEYKGDFYGKIEFNYLHNIDEIYKIDDFEPKKCSIKIQTLWESEDINKKEEVETTINLDKKNYIQSQESNLELAEISSNAYVKLIKMKKTKKAKEQLNQELAKKSKKKIKN